MASTSEKTNILLLGSGEHCLVLEGVVAVHRKGTPEAMTRSVPVLRKAREPTLSTRPVRCSSRAGFQGRSWWMTS